MKLETGDTLGQMILILPIIGAVMLFFGVAPELAMFGTVIGCAVLVVFDASKWKLPAISHGAGTLLMFALALPFHFYERGKRGAPKRTALAFFVAMLFTGMALLSSGIVRI